MRTINILKGEKGMKLVPYDKTKLSKGGYAPTANYTILIGFIESGLDCVQIEDYPHKSIDSCQASISCSIKHFRMNQIRCIRRKGKLYLIRNYP